MEAVMTYAQVFFGWLLQTTLIASLVICLILLIQRILGNKLGPRWCHALWLVLLVRMILPWSPSSRVSLSNLIPSWQRQIQSQQLPGTIDEQEVSPPKQTSEAPEAITSQETESEIAAQEQDAQRPRTLVNAEAQSRPRLASIRRVLPILWLAGVIVIGAYLLVSDLALWRIVKRDSPLVNQPILELFEECKAQMGIQSIVVVVPSDRVRSPGLFGFVRPRLLLPRQMLDTSSAEEMRYVFLHELAHLKRHDIYLGWLASLLQVLHWFNPIVWFAFYRMRVDRELACDALVLTRTGQDKSQEYGGAIIELVKRFSRCRPLPAMAGIIESKSQLKRRIAMITKFRNNSYRFSPIAAVLIIILASVSLPDAISIKASESSTSQPTPSIVLRKVWEGPDVDNCGKISPDGQYLSYVDWDTGDLAIYEIATGKKRHLTNKGSWKESDEFADFNRWSPDSLQIVYAWYNQSRPESGELRVIDIDGSAEPRILFRDESYIWVSPCDWSKDGKHILAWPQKKGGSELAVLSVVDGSLRILKKFPRGRFNNAVFSPEGDNIIYDDLNGDIIILSVKSGEERTLVKHPANDSVLGWGADGKYLLFTSDRSGLPDIWAVRVEGGEAIDDPWIVKSGMGVDPPRALGTTKAGLFYFSHFPRQTDVYVTEIDPESGDLLSPPREAINFFVGSNATPDYSPDGKYMAYVRKSSPVGNLLCIRSLETGKERSFRPSDLDVFGFPRWSPDGRSLLVIATGGINIRTKNGEMGLYTVNTQTGESELIVKTQTPHRLHDHAWGIDEKSVIFVRSTMREDVNGYTNMEIVQREISNGKESTLLSGTLEDIYNISRSLQGRWLAVLGKSKKRALRIIPLTEGEPRDVYTFEQESNIEIHHTWSADGKYILIAQLRKSQGNKKKWDLCRIAVEDGESQNLGLDMFGFQSLSMHPDGRHIAFSSQAENYTRPAIWVMENFLPEKMGK